ncbi:PP2C family protein-serine/threonine phosphatase [Massilia scottii]|uniref:PP2C family protein-serine/threonine phosphatase n=1 Tax=Massilia scottii TaxID=3057166 RepID=UPI002796C294|nr:protein phosphatase [Massilia sp. CCM 9029]MDQ1832979.1 protein phosphatase [Massilia sp. CCM 9029]
MTTAAPSLDFGPYLDVSVHSCAGADAPPRLENQDNYLVIDSTGSAVFLRGQAGQRQHVADWPAGHMRVAVLDGMGGHGRGREAAESVVAGLLEMPACHTLGDLSARLDLLHGQLQRQFGCDPTTGKRPGTTLTMLELRPDKPALLYHVGDSRLYEIIGAHVTPMTVDHVPATAFAMGGLLGEHEWWQQVHGEHRSQISQAFILGNAFANPAELADELYELSPRNLPSYLYHLPDRRALELDPRAVYLLASDGFWACADPCAWLARWPALFEGQDSARAISEVLFAEMRSNPPPGLHIDNLTAIVLRPLVHDETAAPISTQQLYAGEP